MHHQHIKELVFISIHQWCNWPCTHLYIHSLSSIYRYFYKQYAAFNQQHIGHLHVICACGCSPRVPNCNPSDIMYTSYISRVYMFLCSTYTVYRLWGLRALWRHPHPSSDFWIDANCRVNCLMICDSSVSAVRAYIYPFNLLFNLSYQLHASLRSLYAYLSRIFTGSAFDITNPSWILHGVYNGMYHACNRSACRSTRVARASAALRGPLATWFAQIMDQ